MKKNFLWLFSANIIKGLYQWLVLILIVKYYSNYEVAEFTFAYALAAPVFMFANMQLKSIYVVDHNNNDKQINYFILRLFTVLICIVGFLFYFEITKKMSLIFIVIIFIKSIESIFDMFHGYFQKIERMEYMSKSLILQSIFSLVAFFIIINYQYDLYLALFSVLLVNIIVLICYDFKIINQIQRVSKRSVVINYKFIRNILYNSIPLGFAVFLTSYTTNLPRLGVEEYLGVDSLAFFGAFSYMSIGLFQMLLPLQIIIRPKLAKALRDNNQKIFLNFLFLSILITVLFTSVLYGVFSLYGNDIITLVYNKSYLEYLDVLLYLLLGQSILYITGFLNIAVQAHQIFKLQVFISSLVLVTVYFTSSYFIQTFSLIGASYLVVFYGVISLLSYSILLLRLNK
jgi:O-antigen/teichoic acid export membrane protein